MLLSDGSLSKEILSLDIVISHLGSKVLGGNGKGREKIGKVPVLSFGNSTGDCAMHNYCLSNTLKCAAFMLIADDEDRDHANRQKALDLAVQWREAGYHVISMRDDFKTIYGFNVRKVPFSF